MLTAFSLHLQVPDGASAVGSKPYLRLSLGTRFDATFGLNAYADYTQVVTTRPPIEAITGHGTLEFILGDTPADLRLPPPPSPGHLNPAVLENATLVLIYQGKITWSERSR